MQDFAGQRSQRRLAGKAFDLDVAKSLVAERRRPLFLSTTRERIAIGLQLCIDQAARDLSRAIGIELFGLDQRNRLPCRATRSDDDTVFVGSFNLSRSGEMNAENVLEIARSGARRADGGVRRRGPRALSGDVGALAGDGDDLRGLVGERRDLEVGGRDPARRRAARRAPSRAAPTSSRVPTRTTGWSTASPVWIRVITSNSSSSVP